MPVRITLVCAKCHEECGTVIDGWCAWCAYARADLPPDQVLVGNRVRLTTDPPLPQVIERNPDGD